MGTKCEINTQITITLSLVNCDNFSDRLVYMD